MNNIFQLFPANNKDFIHFCKKDVALTRIKAQSRAALNPAKEHKSNKKEASFLFIKTPTEH
ncbi:hypothetical protein SAMN04487898_119109 [Pedobacter sp. ok626]|uniref:hypothetical protein n=1 Tax=Pedobacter sp. ok626 TaxID=1761882 RepID=UPI00088349A1|nr:hypothetical protein [Pedobacter sp. ok626]SDL48581.1 hypothetical protein SAMN04487898_119109 [Pedobacter sp. ok626]